MTAQYFLMWEFKAIKWSKNPLSSRPSIAMSSEDVQLFCAAEIQDTTDAKTFLGICKINGKKNPTQIREDRNATCGSGNPSAPEQQKQRSFMPCQGTQGDWLHQSDTVTATWQGMLLCHLTEQYLTLCMSEPHLTWKMDSLRREL